MTTRLSVLGSETDQGMLQLLIEVMVDVFWLAVRENDVERI